MTEVVLNHHVNEGVSRRNIASFLICLGLTVAGGILLLTGFGPVYFGQSLAFAAAVLGGATITVKSVRTLFQGTFGVDLLASVAIWISVSLGEYVAAAIVVIMLNGGEIAEDIATRRSSKAMEKLIKSAPLTAHVRRNNEIVEVELAHVKIGDTALVRMGEKIPIDGIVTKGNGSVNQAAITGESIPSEKTVGSEVYANTLLESGALDIEVSRRSEDTIFARIVAQVKEAQSKKAPVERIADKYAHWFAPIILVAAVITQLVMKNPLNTAAVLVISCPCALTLATPIAIVAGIGNAARNGVLIRGGPSLEEVGRCDVVVIDKTGTVTSGKPRIVDIRPLEGQKVDDVLTIAGSAERRSEHFLAKAILEEAQRRGLDLDDPDEFQASSGLGVTAKLGGHLVVVGNLNLLRQHRIQLDDTSLTYISSQSMLGRTTVVVARDSEAVGIISISDTLREGVHNSVSRMKAMGVDKVVMLTGDSPFAARDAAQRVGIDEVYADLLPVNKVEHVREYQQQGREVIVVGDGVNDAPALATANVGIAMGIAGTSVAMETAGIVLMTDDLGKVAKIINLSRKVISVIRQNVAFSIAVNVLGLMLSTQGIVSPVLASMIHEGNALIVVFNSLRLLGSHVVRS